jgi:oxygen-independent coproporphyrinogen-3 oxidase
MPELDHLLEKYNQPVPRYTSYPTVPFWKEKIDTQQWKKSFCDQFQKVNHPEGISLYLHLPFCESLCTYCGCNKKITTHHDVEEPYLDSILREFRLYLDLAGSAPLIREMHLGGGTPTFFSPENLERLITGITKNGKVHPQHEFSIEGHPNNTSRDHLQTLYKLGFRRISFGVQDLDPQVQYVINRIQPFEKVKEVTEIARSAGFTSVNFDLIYGLPLQTRASIENTFRQILSLRPDRIAFYSYAHTPWVSRGQRLFDESDLPTAGDKLRLYLLGRQILLEGGYYDIGMDHFALPQDDLYMSWQNGNVHRNFMGYTTHPTTFLLGLGVSSISDTGNAYAQNEKTVHNYYERINRGELAVQKGYFLSEEDKSFRNYILDLACRGKTILQPRHLELFREYCFPQLQDLEKDGLIHWDEDTVEVTMKGRNFLRNICRAFDLHLLRATELQKKSLFSKAI